MRQPDAYAPLRRDDGLPTWLWPLVQLIFLAGYWLFAWLLERPDLTPFLSRYWNASMPIPLPGMLVFAAELLHPRVLRHLIPVAVGWWLARGAAIGLVQTLYQMPDRETATEFFTRLRSGGGGSTLLLDEPELDDWRHKSVLLRVGGPGKVRVPEDKVAVTEQNGRFRRVLSPGQEHQLARFEYVRSLLDLRPQERAEPGIPLVTKDGIDVTADLRLRYRVFSGGEPATPTDPYPFSEEAVRAAAYAQSVMPDGKVGTWATLPARLARGGLRRIVARYRLDEMLQLANAAERPLEAIQTELTRQLRGQLQPYGIELLGSVLITRLELPEAVTAQYIRYWQVDWETRRRISEADGTAVALEEMEIARAEAEITMVQAIVEGVQRARRDGAGANMGAIIAMRLIDALEQTARQSQRMTPLPANLLPQIQELRQRLGPGEQAGAAEAGRPEAGRPEAGRPAAGEPGSGPAKPAPSEPEAT